MKTVFINSELLNFSSSRSAGLISGFLSLKSKGCTFFTDNSPDEIVTKIFSLEDVSFNTTVNTSFDFTLSPSDDSILINHEKAFPNFIEAADYILSKLRFAFVERVTKETNISVKVSLDSREESSISTGIGFFDHMLAQIARHGNIFLQVKTIGDLDVDEHHTVEDTGLALGTALSESLGSKSGIQRYGFFLPMDDSAAYCTIDLGGRTCLNFNAKFQRETVGGFPTELTEEFFRAIASGLKANIYIKASGKNDHHKIEAIFKSFAKALNEACRLDERVIGLPSTKGIL